MAGTGSEPGLTTVATYRPDGTGARWLGAIGHVTPPVYTNTLPGGPGQLTCTLEQESVFRSDALNPGRLVKAWRGGSCVWNGTLLEPSWSQGGWQITANGAGNWGANYVAIYTTWTNQNDAVNQAIARGLGWVNPGIPSGVWLGQQPDSGSQTITDLLNLFAAQGGYTWHVGRGNVLRVYPWATSPVTRILTCSVPVARTLGGDVDVLYGRYESSADGPGGAAAYALASASVAAQIPAHGRMEAYADLSASGVLTSGQASANLANVLSLYQRASFAGPFTVRRGEYLTPGGTPVDLGCEQAGEVVRLILTDTGYGGEVTPGPVEFVVGEISYDDSQAIAAITPFNSLDLSVQSLLGTLGLAGGTAAQERANPALAGLTT